MVEGKANVSKSVEGCTVSQQRNSKATWVFIVIGIVMIIVGYILMYTAGMSVLFSFDFTGFAIGTIIGVIMYYLGWLSILIGVILFFMSCTFKRLIGKAGQVGQKLDENLK